MSLEGTTVGDMMTTALITMKAREKLASADLDMRLAGIRHLPVVDDRNHVIGILSNRDVARALGQRDVTGLVVGDVMSKHVVTVQADTSAALAAELMIEHKIGALPVIGDEEQIIGLVTETDFLEIARRALAGEE
jgi:CBS domain-containing protein